MAGDEKARPPEEAILHRLRNICITTILAMVVLQVVVDTLGKVFLGPTFHVSEAILGILIGALITLVFGESISRIPRGGQ